MMLPSILVSVTNVRGILFNHQYKPLNIFQFQCSGLGWNPVFLAHWQDEALLIWCNVWTTVYTIH